MVLGSVIRDLIRGGVRQDEPREAEAQARVVLNVGGGSAQIPIPEHYRGWRHVLLDVDPRAGPDIVHDARELTGLAAGQFDAVYCSHNLEHYYRHDARRVLAGFLHVLKPDGFAEIRVPDLKSVMERVVAARMDIDDVLYQSAAGPITVRDVIYGWSVEIERSGRDFYAHKTGFTAASLAAFLRDAGFAAIVVDERPAQFEVSALAFRAEPTPAQRALLRL